MIPDLSSSQKRTQLVNQLRQYIQAYENRRNIDQTAEIAAIVLGIFSSIWFIKACSMKADCSGYIALGSLAGMLAVGCFTVSYFGRLYAPVELQVIKIQHDNLKIQDDIVLLDQQIGYFQSLRKIFS